MDWNTWWIGSRTQWNVTKDFYMGVDVLYPKMNSGSTPNGLLGTNLIHAGGAVAPVFVEQPGQLVVPVPRPSRLLSLIG